MNSEAWPVMYLVTAPLLLGLLATAHASRPLPQRSPSATPPHRDKEFTIAMRLNGPDGTFAPLRAAYLDDRGVLLQADNTTGAPGSLVYINSTGSDTDPFPDALVLDLTDSSDPSGAPPGTYGLSVADPGDARGASPFVYATLDGQQFDYHVADGLVYHRMTAAAQNWFSCEDTQWGVAGTFLSWGVYQSDHSAPAGCKWTEVRQFFDLAELELDGAIFS